jgi:limonene-1,2-epoxide hydrolase
MAEVEGTSRATVNDSRVVLCKLKSLQVSAGVRRGGEAMSPEEIVRAEMAAWGCNDIDEVMSYFAENLTVPIGPYAPVSGHDAIRKTMEGYFSGGTCVDHEIIYLAAVGDVVLMERIDHWIIDGKTLAIPHMGACEVKDQKITAWREYFTPPGDS